MPKKLKLLIYNANVLSNITYGIEMYGSMSDTKRKRLQIISNKLLKKSFIMNPLYSTNQPTCPKYASVEWHAYGEGFTLVQ